MEMDDVSISDDIKMLIQCHPSLSIKKAENNFLKVHCSLTGHEMPCQVHAILSYVHGKKYFRFKGKTEFNFSKYEPHLMPSKEKGHENQLYCSLTQRHINRIPEHVERHVSGKRFKAELKRYDDCIQSGKEFKPRRKPQKKIEKETENARKADEMSTELEMISSDVEEERDAEDDGEESDDSFSDLYPVGDFTASASSASANPKETNQNSEKTERKKKIFKGSSITAVKSSKSKIQKNRRFGTAKKFGKGLKQPTKTSKSKTSRIDKMDQS